MTRKRKSGRNDAAVQSIKLCSIAEIFNMNSNFGSETAQRYIHLMAYGTSTEANCRTLERTHQICLRWAQKRGASFAPKKYEFIHLHRSPKKFNMEAKTDLGAHQIFPKAELNVLGLWIDGKLRWGRTSRKCKQK